MIKYQLLLLLFGAGLAGCVDNVDSVTREYRNMNNEVIDAMMMVTSEKTAARMNVRVFKPMTERYAAIDKKLKVVRANRDPSPFAKEVLTSDGVQLYLTDLQVNRQRFALEMTRLRQLHKQLLDRERENDPQATPDRVCPVLHELVGAGKGFDPLRSQLANPGLLAMMVQFPAWKIEDYDAMFMKFAKRRQTFLPTRDPVLAY